MFLDAGIVPLEDYSVITKDSGKWGFHSAMKQFFKYMQRPKKKPRDNGKTELI